MSPPPPPIPRPRPPAAGLLPIPHQAPFRLLDRVLAFDLTDRWLRAERRLTLNDALWPGESQPPPHFSADPAEAAGLVFPATLLVEALCQAAACFNSLALAAAAPDPAQLATPHHGYLVAIRDFRFPAFAYVGETARLEVAQREQLGQVIAFACCATIAAPSAQSQPREIACGRLLFAVTRA
jgi:3-hydroxymyristoyl/3-hydroxydecanoyl-(acyl carrier protein) dehydratase